METVSKAKINREMTIGEIVQKHPEVVETLLSFGVHCVGCHVSAFESLEDGLRGHGMSDEEVDRVVDALNKALESHKPTEKPKAKLILTKTAAKKLKEFMSEENKSYDEGWGLRIQVMPGGCSGLKYDFTFDHHQQDDEVLEFHAVRIFIDKASLDMIQGSTIDFVSTLHGSGFKVDNPNATNTCGCGDSFS